MKPKQAKSELEKIRNQKTVRISRLNKILDVLDYVELEKRYIQSGKKIKRQREEIKIWEKRAIKKC